MTEFNIMYSTPGSTADVLSTDSAVTLKTLESSFHSMWALTGRIYEALNVALKKEQKLYKFSITMSMNSLEEDLQCIESDKVILNMVNVLIYPVQDQRRLTRGLRDVRMQSSLHF